MRYDLCCIGVGWQEVRKDGGGGVGGGSVLFGTVNVGDRGVAARTFEGANAEGRRKLGCEIGQKLTKMGI